MYGTVRQYTEVENNRELTLPYLCVIKYSSLLIHCLTQVRLLFQESSTINCAIFRNTQPGIFTLLSSDSWF